MVGLEERWGEKVTFNRAQRCTRMRAGNGAGVL